MHLEAGDTYRQLGQWPETWCGTIPLGGWGGGHELVSGRQKGGGGGTVKCLVVERLLFDMRSQKGGFVVG